MAVNFDEQLVVATSSRVLFDDETTHCDFSREHVATGHVPHGVANE